MTKRTYKYEVWGFGAFPLDMLRYDQAKVISKRDRPDKRTNLGRDSEFIWLIEGSVKPTIGRWESFLWHVKENI